MNRCSESVVDTLTKRTRKCKLRCHFRNVCYIHAQTLYNDYATVIQRIWKGFQKRKKLKNLFYDLPKDLQENVMKYVRQDHYIEKKWIPSVRKIYQNRLFNVHALRKDLYMLVNNHEIAEDEYYYQLYLLISRERSSKHMLDLLLD